MQQKIAQTHCLYQLLIVNCCAGLRIRLQFQVWPFINRPYGCKILQAVRLQISMSISGKQKTAQWPYSHSNLICCKQEKLTKHSWEVSGVHWLVLYLLQQRTTLTSDRHRHKKLVDRSGVFQPFYSIATEELLQHELAKVNASFYRKILESSAMQVA